MHAYIGSWGRFLPIQQLAAVMAVLSAVLFMSFSCIGLGAVINLPTGQFQRASDGTLLFEVAGTLGITPSIRFLHSSTLN